MDHHQVARMRRGFSEMKGQRDDLAVLLAHAHGVCDDAALVAYFGSSDAAQAIIIEAGAHARALLGIPDPEPAP